MTCMIFFEIYSYKIVTAKDLIIKLFGYLIRITKNHPMGKGMIFCFQHETK